MGSAIGCCFDIKIKSKHSKTLIDTRKLSVFNTNSIISQEDIFKIYVIGEKIGAGNFSTVVKATTKIDNKVYAVKIINKKKVLNKKYEFVNEIRILQKLDHPNIIKLYEIYECHDKFYLVMEYLSGPNLSIKIEKDGNISEYFIASVLYKILSAINYCHSIGICHRDIKPENIMFNDNEVKIIDFGLSKKFHSGVAKFKSFLGTPYYVAPEVIKQEYSFNCDMWSIGATAFKLITGQPPFPNFDKLVHFNKQYKFKCLIMEIIVQIIEDDQITKLNKLFHAIDLNHEGFISLEELQKAFEKSGIDVDSNDVNNIIKQIDLDKNGRVNYSEFLIATLDLKKLLQNNKNLITLFQFFDVDNTGFIDFNTVKKSLERKGKEIINTEDIIVMISEVSQKKNKIHLEDFKTVLESFL